MSQLEWSKRSADLVKEKKSTDLVEEKRSAVEEKKSTDLVDVTSGRGKISR